ncbi:MAG: electron transfer flavoprotein subunit beta/FixA family protein [Oscillospiraceae bacterium]|nr:electron transfer flavoprotein subunit beta/FixA family protein [Oscillospiraceae bacterium]
MNLLVCVKQVPNTEELKVDADAGTSNLDTIPKILSTFDACAVETAVRLKEAGSDVKITVLTVGPDKAKDILKACIAVGADKAYHVNDEAFAELDSLAVSYVLSQAVAKIEAEEGAKFDLVLLGRQANDTDAGQVGAQLAEYLGCPQLSYARELSIEGGKARAVRETEDGLVVMDAELPAVVTVTKTEYDLRFPSVKTKMAANKAVIPVFTAADLGDAANIWQPVKTLRTYIPERKSGGVKIEEETGELSAEKLTALLSDAGVI